MRLPVSRILRGGEIGRLDVGDVALHGVGHDACRIGVATEEAWGESLVDAEHVVHDEHLAVDSASGSDADDRYRQFVGHSFSEFGGDFLQDYGEATDLFEEFGVFDKFAGLGLLFGADVVCAEFIDALRSQSEVAMTGIPALRIRSTDSLISEPPSILTASAWLSFMMRTAEARASIGLP